MHVLFPIAEYALIFVERYLGAEFLILVELIYHGQQSLRNCLKNNQTT